MVPKAGGTITGADGASLVATPLARAVRSNATLSWRPDLILKICGAIETTEDVRQWVVHQLEN
jgi:hypothetical protein